MAYHGHISPEFTSGLEISERSYLYELLAEQLEEEKKRHDREEAQAKSQASKIKSASNRGRR